MQLKAALILSVLSFGAACGSHGDGAASASAAAAAVGEKTATTTAATSTTPSTPSSTASSVAAASKFPPDGKYEHVTVEGKTVPMIEVMNGGNVVLVDTIGKKPRTWQEQYKRKGNIPLGSFDIHKTDANKNGKFDDDPIDREGLWVIDEKGNIEKR
jgi:ABC-type glycerol-3-phosphate transport system substrate-binding protein